MKGEQPGLEPETKGYILCLGAGTPGYTSDSFTELVLIRPVLLLHQALDTAKWFRVLRMALTIEKEQFKL